MEVDEREAARHELPQTTILPMAWIRPAVGVEQQSIGSERVVLGPARRRSDGERQLHHRRIENPLLADERHANAVQHQAHREQLPREDIAVRIDLNGKPIECSVSDPGVTHDRAVASTTQRAGAFYPGAASDS